MLKINNISKSYDGETNIIENVSLEVEQGDIFGFIGHNGAGKTTTIKCVVGIHDFDGEILVDGTSIKQNPIACKKKIAFIPDNPDLYEYLTGIQYLNFVADIFEIPKDKRETIIKQEAQDLELDNVLGDLISSYSHGMKQKLAVIGALIHQPKLLVLDEPFVGLDPKAALTLKNKMHALCDTGSAIFFSTHVLDVAEKLCNKIAIIQKGTIVVSGKIDEITNGESLEDLFMEVVNND